MKIVAEFAILLSAIFPKTSSIGQCQCHQVLRFKMPQATRDAGRFIERLVRVWATAI